MNNEIDQTKKLLNIIKPDQKITFDQVFERPKEKETKV